MKNTITNPAFFSAGNAIFTVSNNKCNHYTYRITKSKGKIPLYSILLMDGTQNTKDYSYMGIFNPITLTITLSYASMLYGFTDDSIPVNVAQWAIKMVKECKPLPAGYSIQHEGKCCRCGCALTNPKSIELGIGPDCIKYIK